jgi:DNA-binding LacI/PurR family transcriptional regulator
MSVSIIEVAKKAKVSRMTITRVMRGENTVSPKTRDRVLHVMSQLSYVPSPAARAMRSKDHLRQKTSLCFALIFGSDTQLADGFFCDVARGAEEEAARHGLCPLHVHWQETFDASWPRMQSVFAIQELCGAILVGQFNEKEIKAISKQTSPVVLVDGPAPANSSVAAVESDNFAGCRMALDRLKEKDCRRILVLSGPQDHYFTQSMVSAVEASRKHFAKVDIIHTNYTAEAGYQMVREIWLANKHYDGIFGNDELAIGAIRGLTDLHVSVPGEVRVIGFDDIPHDEFVIPRLSSISIDKKHLGREAVNTMVEMTRGQAEASQIKKVIRAKLVVRESA